MRRTTRTLPRGLQHPESFQRFAGSSDQGTAIGNSFDDQLTIMYELLHDGRTTKEAWLRRGEEIIAFLEHALKGPYTDDELASMWFTSGAQTYFLEPDIRAALTHMLDRVRAFQEQNKAGKFVSYWSTR